MQYRRFTHKDATFRIGGDCFDLVTAELVRLRDELQLYVDAHVEFRDSLRPVAVGRDAPRSAALMAAAAEAVGVGPMAAVAATMAFMAAESARRQGCGPLVIENGGDLFACGVDELVVGLYAGKSPLSDKLALRLQPAADGIAVCSSSSVMGHSLSLGCCDLATAVSTNAPLADAAATQAANLVKSVEDVDFALNTIAALDGVRGVIIIKDDRIGIAGAPGELIANRDSGLRAKVTRDDSLGDIMD